MSGLKNVDEEQLPPKSGLRRILNSRVAALLTYPHGVDGYLEQFDRKWSVEDVRAELVAVRRQTTDSVTVQLRPNANWRGFRAGQYLRLSVDVNGVRRTRCFSPTNSVHATNSLIELTCKIGPDSVVARHLSERAEAGDVLHLSQAEGQFALPVARPERVLLISGGSGITPVLSMLRTLTDEGHRGEITFLHYCNRAADQLYASELAAIAAQHYNVQLLRCYTEPGQGGELEGLFSHAQLAQAVPDYRDAETYLCGPPGMMKAVQSAYEQDGIGERLHLEHFSAAPGRSWWMAPMPRANCVLRGASVSPATTATLCSTRPRPRASGRRPAAAWASATPVPAVRPRAACATRVPARSARPARKTSRSASTCRWAR
jgi:stearoyl-CoA 9-desaturase NADPH oxidoreductase